MPQHPTQQPASHPLGDSTRRDLLGRLARLRGQLEGIQRMVESGRYCPDILQQSKAVHAALQGFEKVLLRNHLERCLTHAIQQGGRAAVRARKEILDLLYRYVR